MRQFDEDEKARQWRQLYSADNMRPPSDTQNIADVAAMMAFYSPTNFCKFQKLLVQQLLDWESRQACLNPYPLSSPSITIVDIGAGVGSRLETWQGIDSRALGHYNHSSELCSSIKDVNSEGHLG